ncbi:MULTISPECIES: hypothetical protein [unclassified Streptomyces]|uniref:hypothetical protein n=1 Tax=unclassified Streptomyces TaxID=2593676 RepID=UPI00365BB175
MSGIRREHVRVLNVDDETGHTGRRSAVGTGSVTGVGTGSVTATGGRPCRVVDGASVPCVGRSGIAHSDGARSGIAHSRGARGGVRRGDALDGTRRDTDGPEHRPDGPEPRADGLSSAPTTHAGRGAAYARRPTEVGR